MCLNICNASSTLITQDDIANFVKVNVICASNHPRSIPNQKHLIGFIIVVTKY